MRASRVFLTILLAATAGALTLSAAPKSSGPRVVELRGFKYAEYYDAPQETKLKSRLQGATARPITKDQIMVTGARLETFRETGEPELVMETSECTHDTSARTIHSSGPLLVRMADGSFSISGVGFLFLQTNRTLTISNQVETIAHPELLQGRGLEGQNDRDSGVPLKVFSNEFEYSAETSLGVYRGNVQVTGTNLDLSCGLITLKLPVEERRLRNIVAEQDVHLDYEGMKAQGQKAVYDMDSGIAVVTGNPTWSSEGREGRADRFTIDRTNRLVVAEGNAWLRMPGQSLAANLMPRMGGETSPSTNGNVTATEPPGAQSVEVRSASYELRTNVIVFERKVVVTEMSGANEAGQLTCSMLTATFAGTNQLDRLLAEGGVEISRGENRLFSRQATYTGTNGLLVLEGQPGWQAGPRDGKGRLITVDTTKNEMHVEGNALMRMPAEALSAVTATPGAASDAPAQPGTDSQMATITSDEYFVRPERAFFRGGVTINHPQTFLTCKQLTVEMPPEGGHVAGILAEENVEFELVNEKGQRMKGSGRNAIYTYKVTGSRTNEQLHLIGQAVLQTTNGISRNEVFIYDRVENKVSGAGSYSVNGVVPGGRTNLLQIPSKYR